MSHPLTIRLMRRTDLRFCDSLRAEAGWNQTKDDWLRLLMHQPNGCFVAEWNNECVGTVTTTSYGTEVAWIGMVLVREAHRGKGVGRALLEQAVAHLQAEKIACIKLDATPLGQPLYESYGFKPEWSLQRWETRRLPSLKPLQRYPVRLWRYADLNPIGDMDTLAFGVSRLKLLRRTSWNVSRPQIYETPKKRLGGFGLIRAGSNAAYLGPIVASTFPFAGALIKSFLQPVHDRAVYWDVPDQNEDAVQLAKLLGFRPQRPLLRMYLGENRNPGNVRMQYAIAGPEVG